MSEQVSPIEITPAPHEILERKANTPEYVSISSEELADMCDEEISELMQGLGYSVEGCITRAHLLCRLTSFAVEHRNLRPRV